MEHIFSRGVIGKEDAKGNITRPGCKFIVVYQPNEGDDPLPYFHAASETDAREYVKAMAQCGQGVGLRVIAAKDAD